MVVGYARVSTVDQHPEYQIRALEARGCERIFTDRRSSRSKSRPQLDAVLDFLRKGDSLVVWKFDRLERRQCELDSLTEAIDTSSPGGRLAFAIFGAMAQFQADLASERTKEAHKAAKAVGNRWGRPSVFHDPATVQVAQALLRDDGVSSAEAARRLGVHSSTLRRWFPGSDPDAFRGRNGGKA